MALSTVISAARTAHRTARVASGNAYQGTLALDWANGLSITFTSTAVSTGVIDASNDRVVFLSPGPATGCFITVATSPSASSSGAAGSLFIGVGPPVPIYVPAGMAVSGVTAGSSTTLAVIPALIAADPG